MCTRLVLFASRHPRDINAKEFMRGKVPQRRVSLEWRNRKRIWPRSSGPEQRQARRSICWFVVRCEWQIDDEQFIAHENFSLRWKVDTQFILHATIGGIYSVVTTLVRFKWKWRKQTFRNILICHQPSYYCRRYTIAKDMSSSSPLPLSSPPHSGTT